MEIIDLAIVVVAYNRPESLRRLLQSLVLARYNQPVKLIISVDKGGDEAVISTADTFAWEFGEKEVIKHTEPLGLRNHILFCGGLTERFDAAIILEDDLMVSPSFFEYALRSVSFYRHDAEIAGISLYSNGYNHTANRPFQPLPDGSDVYFMQIPSSWGQVWTREQWMRFDLWYKQNFSFKFTPYTGVPVDVFDWPDSSWKKYFFAYMVSQNQYFVYPQQSLSTNFGEVGTHFARKTNFIQVPMLLEKNTFNFTHLKSSNAVYDAYCELHSSIIKKLNPNLADYDFDVDLYGAKPPEVLNSTYLLTSKTCSHYILGFARELRPPEYNIILSIPGSDLLMTQINHCYHKFDTHLIKDSEFLYYYNLREFQIRKTPTIPLEKFDYGDIARAVVKKLLISLKLTKYRKRRRK